MLFKTQPWFIRIWRCVNDSVWYDGNEIDFILLDHPYILSFSLIMLHTDAFNKSNKRKMTKADYIKNTKLVGVPTEVLDVSTIYLGQ